MCDKHLMPDVVVPKVHQNNRSYVSSADLPLDSLCKNLAWCMVTQRTLENHKTVKIGGGHLRRYGHLPGTIRYLCRKWPMHSNHSIGYFY